LIYFDDFSGYPDQSAFEAAYDNVELAGGEVIIQDCDDLQLQWVHMRNDNDQSKEVTRFRTKDAIGSSENLVSIQFGIKVNSIQSANGLLFALQDNTLGEDFSLLDDKKFLSKNLDRKGDDEFHKVDIVVNNTGSTIGIEGTSDFLDTGMYNVYIDGARVVANGTFTPGAVGDSLDIQFFTLENHKADVELDDIVIRNIATIDIIPEPATMSLIGIAGCSMLLLHRLQKRWTLQHG
jgi:hypothetical protein